MTLFKKHSFEHGVTTQLCVQRLHRDRGLFQFAVTPLEAVATIAQDIGMKPGYAVGLPADEIGVFTLSNPWPSPAHDERTVYLDQYSGDVLAEAGWDVSLD